MTKSRPIATFVILFSLAAFLQWLSGAFHTGFTGYPDEPAHVVTTVMVREYVLQGLPGNPLAFAQEYYRHYPKVGLGHWPPLFYAIASVWTVAAPHSRVWLLLLMAVFTAATGTLFAHEVARRFGPPTGIALGAAFVLIPSVQAQTGMVMLDILLALTALAAALSFAKFLDTANWRHSVAFGLFAALTILTKGNGFALALLPPLAIALTGRWRLLRTASLWVAVVPVALLCGPWQYFTRGMADQGWEQPYPTAAYTISSLARFGNVLFDMSPPLFLLAVVGLWPAVIRPMIRRQPVAPFQAVMAALLLAVWIFHSVVPAGVEDRKMIMGLCGLLAFVPEGFRFLTTLPRARLNGLASVIVALFFLWGFNVPAKPRTAFLRAASDLTTHPDLSGDALVSSNGDGEGYLISELALIQPRPQRVIVRATKLLARTDWSGHEFEPRVHSETELISVLDSVPVDLLILDQSAGRFHFHHQEMLRALVDRHPEQWKLVDSIADSNAQSLPAILVYTRVNRSLARR